MKRSTLLIFTTLFLALFSTLQAPAQNLQKAWEYLLQNKDKEARTAFENALSGPHALEARLGLNLLAAEFGTLKERSMHLQKIYELADDPIPYLLALQKSFRGGRFSKEEVAFFEQIAETQKGHAKAMALQILGGHYRDMGKHEISQKYYDQIGSITKWSVLGEFENISASGFDKDFGALAHPEKDHPFVNKRGVQVKWFDIKDATPSRWIDMEYYFYASNSIIYAQNFCRSPKEQEVQFRIGVSGSVKVWLNDQLLFEEEHERNNDLDSYIFTAKLMSGYNRILIQLGESEAGNCNFLLRITDDEGENIPNLSFTTRVSEYPKDYHYQSKVIPDPTENFFLKKLEENPNDAGHALTLIEHYLFTDRTFKAKKTLKPWRKKYPDNILFMAQEYEAHRRDNNQTLSNTLEEEIKIKAPDSPSGLLMRFEDAMDKEDYTEAEKILAQREKISGRTARIISDYIRIASERSEREKIFSLIHEGYQKFPDDYDFVYAEYYLALEVEKSPSQAQRILRKYLKNHYNEAAKREMAAFYFQQNSVESGLKEYYDLIKYNPIATGYYSTIADILFRLGRYNDATEYARECTKIAPYIGSYYRRLGQTYAELDEKNKAKQYYQHAITYNPYDYKARKLLRQLEGQEDVFSDISQYDVYQLCEKAPDASQFPEDNSIILLNDLQKIVYENGGSEERHVLLVKVFDNAGVDNWKEYSLPVYNNQRGLIEEMEVIKANGKRIQAQNDGAYIVFSNLEPGDAIHISYRVENYYSGKLTTHFWGDQFFSAYIPIQNARLALLVPKSKTFKYVATQPDLIRENKKDIGNLQLFEWTASDVPAIEYEPYMPEFADVAALLHYSSMPDWDFVADWYADLVKSKTRTDFEVNEIAAEIFEGQNLSSDKDKARAIYNYITNNVRYRSVPFLQSGLIPQKASTTISERQGDCKDVSTLFVSLCKTQNIPAELMLVNTRDNGENAMPLPSIDFNHCMVKIKLDEQDYILELTSEDLPFSSISPITDHAFALPIPIVQPEQKKSEPLKIDAPTLIPGEVHRQSEISFENDKMIVQKNSRKTGAKAASMRNTYKHEGREKRFKIMQEAIRSGASQARLISLEFDDNLLNNEPEVSYRYTYELSPAFTHISNLSIFKIPWADALETPPFLNTDDRSSDVLLWQFDSDQLNEETITIHIPQGFSMSEMPENIHLSTAQVEYDLRFELRGQDLIVSRRLKYLSDRIPIDQFQQNAEVFAKIVEADHQNLAFAK